MNEYCKENIEDVFIVLNDFSTLREDIKVLDLGEKQISQLKYEVSEAYGQDGYTKVSEDAFKGFKRTSRLMISSVDSYSRFIDKFFVGLDVEVQYSDDDYKVRYGTISDIIDNVIIGDNREITLEIDLQPFKYDKETKIMINERTTISNNGNVYTEPILKVYGNGKGKVLINLQTMELDIKDYLIIDNKVKDVLGSNGLRSNSSRISGDFFRLDRGKSVITFTGGITRIEMLVNWRWR